MWAEKAVVSFCCGGNSKTWAQVRVLIKGAYHIDESEFYWIYIWIFILLSSRRTKKALQKFCLFYHSNSIQPWFNVPGTFSSSFPIFFFISIPACGSFFCECIRFWHYFLRIFVIFIPPIHPPSFHRNRSRCPGIGSWPTRPAFFLKLQMPAPASFWIRSWISTEIHTVSGWNFFGLNVSASS